LSLQGLVLASPKLGIGTGAALELRLWKGLHAGVSAFGNAFGSIGFFLNGGIGLRTSYRMDVGPLVIAPSLSVYAFSADSQDVEYERFVGSGAAPAGGLQLLTHLGEHFVLGGEIGAIGVGYVVKQGSYVSNPKPDEHRFEWCPYAGLVLGGSL
jgi:hypothetical protein